MPVSFQGFDHVDMRVKSLPAVESFYDAFLGELGLTRKRFSHVTASGDWCEVSDERPHNVAEYYEELQRGKVAFFIGIIEDTQMQPVKTRVAFRVPRSELDRLHRRLYELGARRIEWSDDMQSYPAVFFEDAVGTNLELCARHTPADGY